MKNQCDDYSYFSLNALSYLTTLLFGIGFGLSISIVVLYKSENIYENKFLITYNIPEKQIMSKIVDIIT